MADGDQITADYQFQLGDVLYGADADVWDNDEGPWTGFFGGEVRDQDTALSLVDGDAAGTDTNPARLVTMPISTARALLSAAEATAAADALETAWSASGSVDVDLHYQLGGVHYSLTGRPRGALIDLALLPQGVVRALVKFKAHDPTKTVVGS